ncbi:uncharacterized protein LOC133405163 isoform X2 [Phycodurus eques]|uniref:uncharacterized protein LOC133405163 isoform X2 n=1 Tax=Phycodurus eques TaxID=693459 RepID=UPI002ACDE89B|nr:uncharacterized protein LOC133405163 isoform X2 [Phycodurus eques]
MKENSCSSIRSCTFHFRVVCPGSISSRFIRDEQPVIKEALRRAALVMSVNVMSTNGTSPLWFLDVCDGRFYFQVDVDGVDGAVREDSFRKSQCISYLIQNKDNKYLLLGDNSQFEVQHLTIQKKSLPASQFNVQFYNESGLKVRKGLAVMLYANKNGSKMVVCCSDKREIYPQAMDLPENIETAHHKALFYMTQLHETQNTFMLESSLHPCEFLGFKPEKNNSSQLTLVLHRKVDEVDERCMVKLS